MSGDNEALAYKITSGTIQAGMIQANRITKAIVKGVKDGVLQIEVIDEPIEVYSNHCDYCGGEIDIQIMKNSGACSELHLEYEYWEEMFDGPPE